MVVSHPGSGLELRDVSSSRAGNFAKGNFGPSVYGSVPVGSLEVMNHNMHRAVGQRANISVACGPRL